MRVSALTILHNRVDLFRETVQSVLNQSYPVHELIVVDDGSTEDVQGLLESFNDARIKYFYYKRIGVISKLRNIAIHKSSGDYLAFIDSDDLWHEDKIKWHVEETLKTGADITFSDCRLFNDAGYIGPSVAHDMYKKEVNVFEELIVYNISLAFGSNIFYKKTIQGNTPLLDERLFVGEHDLIIRLSADHPSSFIPQVLNYIRRHDRNVSKPHTVLDIISPLEYNRTLDKLFKAGRISGKQHRKIKAANYNKVAGYYLHKKLYKKSSVYLAQSLQLDFKWYCLRIFLKSAWLYIKS
jgi:glycosyltransferase involved in cell wall biosynthesis